MRRYSIALAFACAAPLFACSSAPRDRFDFDDAISGDGKSDIASHAKIIGDVDLDSQIAGRFQDRTRVYGFTFSAKAGATIQIGLKASAGDNSTTEVAGTPLDTIAAAYGPMDGKKPGPQLAYSDDSADSQQAGIPALKIAQDGTYLVVLSTWDDPGNGTYDVGVSCSGTDFQCRRPLPMQPCVVGTKYIQGRTIVGTETWNSCKVVLLENTVVDKAAVLTITGGTNVQGNYIGTGTYGTVALQVDGTLQAVGTKEAPVLFSALTTGWKGIVLNGPSSTLQQVFIEHAETGVAVMGSGNTFNDLSVSNSGTGLSFGNKSSGNEMHRVRIVQGQNGVVIKDQASVDIEDSVITGLANGTGIGVYGESGLSSHFLRALVAGFDTGIALNTTELEMDDSTITNNKKGVTITGPSAGVHAPFSCPAAPSAPPPPPYSPPVPSSWGRDPVFQRCDIRKNSEIGIRISAPQLLVVEGSNIRDNGAGLSVETDSLAPGSHITSSNIFNNGAGQQVDSQHINGVLDISSNYWAQISDPQLSASWRMTHSQQHVCTTTFNGGCSWNGSTYVCGQYICNTNQQNCQVTITTPWSGQFTFTGFAPEELHAGPNLDTCSQQVKDERGAQGL